MRRLLIVVALVVGGCSGAAPAVPSVVPTATPSPTPRPTPRPTPSPTEEAHTINGVVTVYGFMSSGNGTCTPNDGYTDVNEGTNVVVKDENERTVGDGSLELWLDAPESLTSDSDGYGLFPCVFRWSTTVPRANFYHVTVGRRDGPTASFDELAGDAWTWSLSLGS